jgi:hypothetical protein
MVLTPCYKMWIMGLGGMIVSSSSYDNESESLPNPDPSNFSILRSKEVGDCLVIEIKYHDCTNYEGKKIMVYKCTLDELMNQKLVDPHFSENKEFKSPFARFEPTKDGWSIACVVANVL